MSPNVWLQFFGAVLLSGSAFFWATKKVSIRRQRVTRMAAVSLFLIALVMVLLVTQIMGAGRNVTDFLIFLTATIVLVAEGVLMHQLLTKNNSVKIGFVPYIFLYTTGCGMLNITTIIIGAFLYPRS